MPLELPAALLLVLANGFFVATEFAIARLRPTQVEDLVRDGRAGARSARHAVQHIDAYLAACQLGITLSSLGLGALGKPAFDALLKPVLGEAAEVGGIALSAIAAFSIITLLHVVVGELSPKSLAIARTVPSSLLLAPPMRVFYLATKPVVDVFNAMGNLLLKPFGVPPASEAGHVPHSEQELRDLLRQSAREGLIEVEDRELTERVFAFGDERVREVMLPRPRVDFVTTDEDPATVARRGVETGRTRFPLCEAAGGLDEPVGVIHLRDLLGASLDGGSRDLRELARPLVQLHDSTLLDEALRELRRAHQQLALVIDEHGTVVGLVTVEDIVEELVGEIEDEFDPEASELVVREGETILADASAPLRLVGQELDHVFASAHEATIGGHLLELLGRRPDVGEQVDLDGVRVEVVAIDGERVGRVRLEPRA